MCGRYTSKKNPVEIAEEFAAADRIGERQPDFNVAPTREVPVVRADQHDGTGRELVQMRWGLVPFWAKDIKIGSRMINARVETVQSKPAFRTVIKKRRCIVPCDGWYEWRVGEDGKTKQPYYMTAPDGASLAFAGLWDTWGDKDEPLLSCTIITADATGQLEQIHDRMPFLLPRESWDRWLDPEQQDVQDILSHPDVLRGDQLELRPVGAAVGKVANNGPQLIERIEPESVLF